MTICLSEDSPAARVVMPTRHLCGKKPAKYSRADHTNVARTIAVWARYYRMQAAKACQKETPDE